MTTKTFPLVRGRAMRVTKLDSCGRPVYGDAGQVVSEGYVSVALTTQINEGEEISVTNASGDICVYDPPSPSFTGYQSVVTFCEVNPDIFGLMTGQPLEYDSNGDVVGFRMNEDIKPADTGFALEVWAGVPGEECSDDPNAQGAYGYLLLPRLSGGVLGDFTIENAAINFVLTNSATKAGAGWGTGPFNVVLDALGEESVLESAITSGDHLVARYTEMAPPDTTGGAVPLLDPTDTAITSITATPTGLDVSVAITPDIGFDEEPVAIFWGDGTYSYLDGATDVAEHTYAEAGTYTVEAQRGLSSATDDATVSS